MCAKLEHRGPDARGIHRKGNVALGIQRLRVIDLTTGDAPIYNEDCSVVVLNGEIYNFRELRAELIERGHRFTTRGDTEVIAHLYEDEGADCVRRLHGMFAFALWDARRQQLLLARDRVGKKPLLYSFQNGVLSFASEMAALLADPEIARDVDHAALDAYLALGYVPAPLTAVRGVHKLPPAHSLVLRGREVKLSRYWRLDYSSKLAGVAVEEICERVREGLGAATRRRLLADVSVGAFLSGGIDSSAVVASMAEHSTAPVRTFSIGFDDQDFDELQHARRIAELFGTEHEEFRVRADAVSVLPKLVRHYGEPFADPSAIPSFYLAELTRRHVTVALNGDGDDESFAGYTRYVANALAGRLDILPAPLRRIAAQAGSRLPAGERISSPANRARRLARTLALGAPERYARYIAWFDPAQRRALYATGFGSSRDVGEAFISNAWQEATGEHVVDRMLEVDAGTYLVGDLIAKVDTATMAYGLEARSPFLDHEMMQLAASIPASLKIRGSEKKWILREALRGTLPDEILDRPKQGFSVPLSSWLRSDLSSRAKDVLLDPGAVARGYFQPSAVSDLLTRHAARGDVADGKRIWALVMLELWHRELIDPPAGGVVPAADLERAGRSAAA